MSRSLGPVIVLWGVLLAIATLILVLFFSPPSIHGTALLGGAAAATVIWGAALWVSGRGDPGEPPARIPDLSPPTTLLALALALLATSAVLGPWLAFVALGLAGLAAGGLVREHMARRGQREGPR